MRRMSFVVLLSIMLGLLAACGGGTGTATESPAASAEAPGEASTEASVEASAGASTQASTEASAEASTEASAEASTEASAEASTQASEEAGTEASAEASTEASAEASAAGSAEGSAAGGALPDLGGREILIGTDAAYPPFESVDPASNEIVGFDVDVMNEIAALVNIEPTFENAAFDTIFDALRQDQFDAVMSAATITEERKQIVAFSDPYISVGQLVVVGADNSDITSYTDLANGAIVGVQTGTTGETAALEEAQVPDGNLRRYQTIDVAFEELANGTIDAVVADNPTVGNYANQERYKSAIKVVGEPFTEESYGIAVQQEDTELLEAINAALAQLISDGTINDLKAKWQIQ